MKIDRIDLKDCTAIKLSEILESGDTYKKIETLLLGSVYGRVFVINETGELLGAYSVDDCKNPLDRGQLKRPPCIFEDSGCGSLKEQVLLLLKETVSYGILPVVDKNYILTGAVTCTDNMWDQDKISNLAYLNYLAEKRIDIGYFFRSKGYHKIAFWGIDKLSLTFANTLRHCQNLSVAGIYDNSKLKKYCKENYLNYEAEILFVDSMADLVTTGMADLIILTDWTMRYAGNIQLLESSSIDVIYSNTLLKSLEFQKSMNTFVFLSWKEKLEKAGIDCFSVRIPTEYDLKIKNPKQGNISPEERTGWFAKENGWSKDGPEINEFNASRYGLQKRVIKADGKIYFGDYKSKYINYINKARVTLNTPAEFKHTIYLLGPCIAISLFNQDRHTVGFFLQQYFNEKYLQYKVVALGTTNDADRYYFFNILDGIELKCGDKIFWLEQTFKCNHWDLDTTCIFKSLYQEYGRDFYYDALAHCGKEANRKIAEFIFDYIHSHPENERCLSSDDKNAVCIDKPDRPRPAHNPFAGNLQLEKYKQFIQSQAIHKRPVVGAIVMNCNPFTLGHQYLIEHAASETDFLYIFVVEEDKSFFRFEDRMELVKAGTRHLSHVKVLPSGEFIISSNTFSEYFDKANLTGTTIDTSLDVETFAAQIAPCLDITVRFVGEEPLDPITNQYNQSMKAILPKYGIELRELKRKESENKIISASRVRKCLEENQWDDIKDMVPETTYEFLYARYGH